MSVARAHLHSMRQSARKVRIVLDLIRGKNVDDAYRILSFTRKQASETVLKLLRSAVANASQKGGHSSEGLYVSRTFADGGFHWKRFEPKALMRFGIQKRRTCHVTVEVDLREGAAAAAPSAGAEPAERGKTAVGAKA